MTENEKDTVEITYQPPILVELGEFNEDTLGTGIVNYFELTTFKYLV